MKFTDQLSRTIELPEWPPKKIISIVPSQTELLYDLGLDDEVIGITKFCVHPEKWFRTKKRVGGTKQLNIAAIRDLNPDLIIANKEENLQEQVEQLEKEFPVWISDIKNLEQACHMIRSVGGLVGKSKHGEKLVDGIIEQFDQLANSVRRENNHVKTAYLIWNDPMMTVGGDTFINDMMLRAGMKNIFENTNRYPKTSIDELISLHCELLLLSSEPFPFKEVHVRQMQEQLPDTNISLVDGEMFSWYGSRLLSTPAYLNRLRELVINC